MNAHNKEEGRSVGLPFAAGLPSRSLSRAGAALAVGIAAALLGACGQKGPLYQAKPGSIAKSPAPAASATRP